MNFYSKLRNAFIGNTGSEKNDNTSDQKLFSSNGTLYYGENNKFSPLTAIGGSIIFIKNNVEKNMYSLIVNEVDENGQINPLTDQPLSEMMQMQFHHPTGSVQWIGKIEDNIFLFCFRFEDNDSPSDRKNTKSKKFIDIYNQCIYSQFTGLPLNSKKDEDYDYITTPFSNSANNIDTEESEKEIDEEFAGEDEEFDNTESNCKNICFSNSIISNKAFIVRSVDDDVSINVATYNEKGSFEKSSVTVDGPTNVVPKMLKSCILGNDEKHLFLTSGIEWTKEKNEASSGNVSKFDLTKQKIVSTFLPPSECKLLDVKNQYKDQKEPFLLCGLSQNVAFTFDTRLNPKVAVVAEVGKKTSDYALKSLKPKEYFTCHATSANGYLAIGDRCGSVRLYTGPPGSQNVTLLTDGSKITKTNPKTAKTLIRGTPGEPIISIDITNDGSFVAAATPLSVLIFPTKFTIDKENFNGFEKSLGLRKPPPLSLRPSFEQLQLMSHHVNFTSVVFDKNDNEEQWVAASTGHYILTWSLNAIKKALSKNKHVCGDAMVENNDVSQIDMTGNVQNGLCDSIFYLTNKSIGIKKKETITKRKKKQYYSF